MTGSPKFLENPLRCLLMFFDPGRTAMFNHEQHHGAAPDIDKAKAPCNQHYFEAQ
jgi:hypothetical protein